MRTLLACVFVPWGIGGGIYAATSGHTNIAAGLAFATVFAIMYIADHTKETPNGSPTPHRPRT